MSERSKKSVDEDAFGYHERKDGTVVISYYGRAVTTLRGKEATKFTRHVRSSRRAALDGSRYGQFQVGQRAQVLGFEDLISGPESM
jgi:hypothetical protein